MLNSQKPRNAHGRGRAELSTHRARQAARGILALVRRLTLLCVSGSALSLFGPAPLAAAAEFEYAPERFGVSLGWSQQEVLKSLSRQGFSFAPGGEFLHIRGVRDAQGIFDVILLIGIEHGALDIWHADKVILGIEQGRLAMVEEVNTLPWGEAETVYVELQMLFDENMQASFGDRVQSSHWSAEQVEFADRWASLLWFAPENRAGEPGGGLRYRAWRQGSRLSVLSLQPAITQAGSVSSELGTVLIQHVDWCAFPILDSFVTSSAFECRVNSD